MSEANKMAIAELSAELGCTVTVDDAHGTPCYTVPRDQWVTTAHFVKATWGAHFFDWLTAVDQMTDPADHGVDDHAGFDVTCHLAAPATSSQPLQRFLLRTRVPASDLTLSSLTTTFSGAAWHERETFEMFGIHFHDFHDVHDNELKPLLLPNGFEGNPLRKSFHLAARAIKSWPGAKEPGEGPGGSPSRRKMAPPGVPDPTWGPRQPGEVIEPQQSPRGRRGAKRASAGVRRSRKASDGSTSQKTGETND